MARVQGKVALITGAASGLGLADARRLAEEGAQIVMTDVNKDQGESAARDIPGAQFLAHDVRVEAQWKTAIDAVIARYGRLDILVNNAGLVKFSTVEETSLEDYRLHSAVMSEGAFLGCKHAIPAMARGGGGSIINVSSIGALKGISAIPAYAAAKGAILSLTRSVAVHCQEQGYNIRCNAIAPGAHDTPMTQAAQAELPPEAAGLQQIQTFGQGRPEDVANLVLFLASDESRQITGATIVIDNGETIR